MGSPPCLLCLHFILWCPLLCNIPNSFGQILELVFIYLCCFTPRKQASFLSYIGLSSLSFKHVSGSLMTTSGSKGLTGLDQYWPPADIKKNGTSALRLFPLARPKSIRGNYRKLSWYWQLVSLFRHLGKHITL